MSSLRIIILAAAAALLVSCETPSGPPPNHPWWRGEPRHDAQGKFLGYFAEPEDADGEGDVGGDCPAGRFYDISAAYPAGRYVTLTPSAAERMASE
jgi:hypothetical protein